MDLAKAFSDLFMSQKPMTGDGMIAAAVTLFGERGHVTALAEALDVDRTQVWRWSKLTEIPGPVAAAIECWLKSEKPS